MKNTLYVNFYGAPGAGKSTGAALLFSKLKLCGIDCEYVQEFAKDMVWENNKFIFDDPDNQLFIFASQFYRLNRLYGKVDVVVTDSPLFLSSFYVKNSVLDCAEYRELVKRLDRKFTGLNILVNRDKPYNSNGRNQDETESNKIAEDLRKSMFDSNIDFIEINGNFTDYLKIFDIIMEKIK